MPPFWNRFRHIRLYEDLSAYLDGQLAEGRARRLERHLAACSACHELMADMKAVTAALRRLPLLPAPRPFTLSSGSAKQPESRPLAAWHRPLQLAAISVSLALATLLGIDLASDGPSTSTLLQAGAPATGEAVPSTGARQNIAVAQSPLETASDERLRASAAQPVAESEANAKAELTADADGGLNAIRLAEAALGATAAVSIGGWLIATRRRITAQATAYNRRRPTK